MVLSVSAAASAMRNRPVPHHQALGGAFADRNAFGRADHQ